eukprot:9831263-Heterocapsa_arctica.AAC.1
MSGNLYIVVERVLSFGSNVLLARLAAGPVGRLAGQRARCAAGSRTVLCGGASTDADSRGGRAREKARLGRETEER